MKIKKDIGEGSGEEEIGGRREEGRKGGRDKGNGGKLME